MALLPYPEGYDCVWIGADALGRIAAFVTAGAGQIPTAVLCLPSEEFEELECRLLALPARTVATRVVTNPGADCFLELGERGLFVYDWGDHHRTRAAALGAYEKQAEPAVPIVIGDLSADLASAVAGIRLAAAFGEAAL